jgi:hypothetical protein
LLGGAYRRGPDWCRCKGTRRHYRGSQKRLREYPWFYIRDHGSSQLAAPPPGSY